MKDLEAAALAYVRYVLHLEDMSPSALAKKANLSSTTLTRALNDKSHKYILSMSTVDKIIKATGVSFAPFAAGGTELDIASGISQEFATDPRIWAEPESPQRSVAILNEVAAGNWRELDVADVSRLGLLYLVPSMYNGDVCFGLLVKGTSINNVAHDGDYLLCVKLKAYLDNPLDGSLAAGDLVIVERRTADGFQVELSAKRLSGMPPEWDLCPDSTDPKWAGRVEKLSVQTSARAVITGVVLYVIRDPARKK